MYKVLLVDDEPLIREGLRTLIEWEKYGFSICGEAINGQDGLEKVQQLNPQLIIVDIKMPGMDGLHMIEEVKKLGKQCKIIILTGYSEFTYAQKAVELGVSSFVLKPVEEVELIDKINKAYSLLKDEEKQNDSMSKRLSASREKMVERLVQGQLYAEDINQLNYVYHLELPWTLYQVVLVQAEGTFDKSQLEKIRSQVTSLITENSHGYVTTIDGIVCILMKDVYIKTNNGILKLIQRSIKSKTGLDVLIALGNCVNKLESVEESFKHAYELLKKNFIHGMKGIISNHVVDQTYNTADHPLYSNDEQLMNELYMAVDVNGMERINDLLEGRLNTLARRELSEEQIKVSYINLYFKLINKIVLNNEELRAEYNNNEKFLADVYSKKSLIELNAFVKYKLVSISNDLAKLRPDNLMNRVLDYINRNYRDNIKLETLAHVFNYNSSYLGKIFKSHIGEYFNTYLDRVRINKAKEFLEQGYKVYQVTEMVGYSNTDYFLRKFKKYVGVPPTAYKSK